MRCLKTAKYLKIFLDNCRVEISLTVYFDPSNWRIIRGWCIKVWTPSVRKMTQTIPKVLHHSMTMILNMMPSCIFSLNQPGDNIIKPQERTNENWLESGDFEKGWRQFWGVRLQEDRWRKMGWWIGWWPSWVKTQGSQDYNSGLHRGEFNCWWSVKLITVIIRHPKTVLGYNGSEKKYIEIDSLQDCGYGYTLSTIPRDLSLPSRELGWKWEPEDFENVSRYATGKFAN